MNTEKISLVLIGIGGYGNQYVEALLDDEDHNFEIVGAVDPYPEGCRRLDEIKAKKIPLFSSITDFYKDNEADLAVISSPIHYHEPQTTLALENGSHVLCEKPLAPTVKLGKKIIRKSHEENRQVAIGFQWSYNNAILELKKDIIVGNLGQPQRFKTLVLWPRDFAYYNRNNWAGKIKDEQRHWILDSVAHNATAHYLHNMLFVLGEEIDKSAAPESVEAELYRANDIENYDTAATRVKTSEEVELLYLASHATKEQVNPKFVYKFDEAVVKYSQDGPDKKITAYFDNGDKKIYGDPFNNVINKLWIMMDVVRGKGKIYCPPEAALPQVQCINRMQENTIIDFPQDKIEYIREGEETKAVFVKGLAENMINCYENWSLPGELDIIWSQQ